MNIHIRLYTPADLHSCRSLWEVLTQRHRDIYYAPTISGDAPDLFFDWYFTQIGDGRIWVTELDNQVVGLAGLMIDGCESEDENG